LETQLSKELRLLGMTREEVALKLDITKATLSNWCRGIYPISAVGVRILGEIGVTKKALKDPSKEI